nr:putative ribonuclease H-like domain-containing protein [Tanacetum cinerariifolium]
MVPAVVLTQSKPVYITAVRPVSATVPKIMVTRPRLAHPIITMSKSPIRWHITHSQSLKTSNSPPRVTAVQALVVSAAQGNMSYLSEFEELNGGYVAFGGNLKGGKISGKGKIMTCKLDFDDVYFVKELKFNLFIVSQICNKKNSVLFTDTECLVLSPDFKLPDESQVLLRVPRENNMYNVNLKNIVSSAGHRPNGTHMRPPFRYFGPRPHGNSMRPPFRPAGHRQHGPSMNLRRPIMNEFEDCSKNRRNEVNAAGELTFFLGLQISKRQATLGVRNKMHMAFPLPGESSHWQYKFPLPMEGVPTSRRMEIPLPAVCTAMMKKLPVKEKWQLH